MSERYLSFSEREAIAILHAQELGVRKIARRVRRSPSTISRELRRNASTRSHTVTYRATTARFTLLLHLPRMDDHGAQPRVKNGPALAGHGAVAVRDGIAEAISDLPDQLRRSLTWDQGAEMAQHTQLRIESGLDIFFCDPHSPWQRGTNGNTNGLLRQYFPRGTDLARHSRGDLDAVALALNTRPPKTLGWKTPAEAFAHLVGSG